MSTDIPKWRAGAEEHKDFDEEARLIFAQLNLPADGTGRASGYDPCNCIWRNPTSGAGVFVGNASIASDKAGLLEHGITHIVNCQDPSSENFLRKDKQFKYFRFHVTAPLHSRLTCSVYLLSAPDPAQIANHWREKPTKTAKGVVAFFAEVFQWITQATASSNGVLIHCLAGAHRAGQWVTQPFSHRSLTLPPTCRLLPTAHAQARPAWRS
jgi:hypothetical protein